MPALHPDIVTHWNGSRDAFVLPGHCSSCVFAQPNDGVADTAQQSGANYNCYPRGSALPNSCPNKPATQPLYDPVNNYMGYSESPPLVHRRSACLIPLNCRSAEPPGCAPGSATMS